MNLSSHFPLFLNKRMKKVTLYGRKKETRNHKTDNCLNYYQITIIARN